MFHEISRMNYVISQINYEISRYFATTLHFRPSLTPLCRPHKTDGSNSLLSGWGGGKGGGHGNINKFENFNNKQDQGNKRPI
jgi:hypothetical protein